MAIIGRAGRRTLQRLKIIRTEPVATSAPVSQEPEPPTGTAGEPIGLLLALTKAA